MKKSIVTTIIAVILLYGLDSCQKGKACQEPNALTYTADLDNEEDANQCKYSRAVIFIMPDSIYQRSDSTFAFDSIITYDSTIASIDTVTNDTTFAYDTIQTIDTSITITKVYIPFDSTILPLKIYFDDNVTEVSTLYRAAPLFPNNCSENLPDSLYCVKPLDGEEHTWTAVSMYKSFVFTGKVKANASQPCIPVQIK